MAWNRMFSRPACGRERGSAQEVFMVCFSDVIRHGDGSLECTGFLEKPCGFEGLVVTLRFLADGPAQGGDGLFGVYCHEHCKLLKMTVSSLQGDGAGRATEHKRGSGCSEPRKSANVRLIMI
mmetsp:Transcript_52530/g.137756  ORF Transcript_52530/g.137756 Transcript_52530/m.137756 type:complete len:122 (+) Transcript_52530:2593-2958(+)